MNAVGGIKKKDRVKFFKQKSMEEVEEPPETPNQRVRNRHLKVIESQGQKILINLYEADRENNRAVKVCQDNDKAFYDFKKRQLFPNKFKLSHMKKEEKKNRVVIDALKSLQDSVKLTNMESKYGKYGKMIGDPPLEYPALY